MRHMETHKNFPVRQLLLLITLGIALTYAGILATTWRQYAVGEPGGFAAFYSTIALAHTHGISRIYDPALQNAFHPGSGAHYAYWYHLSYEMLLLWPLGYLSRLSAFLLWTFINVAAILLGTFFFLSRYTALRTADLMLGACAFLPLLVICVNGQDSGLILLGFAFALHEWMQGREVSAGMALAFSLFKFQYAVLTVAVLGWRHRRLLAGFLPAAVVLLWLSFLLVGRQGLHDFLLLSGSDRYETGLMMANVRGIVYAAFGRDVFWCTALVSGALYGFALWLTGKLKDRSSIFAVAVLAAWLLSYHGHFYDAVLLFIPAAVLIRQAPWFVASIAASPILIFQPFRTYWFGALLVCFLLALGMPAFVSRAAVAKAAE